VEKDITLMQSRLNNEIKAKVFYSILIFTGIITLFFLFFNFFSHNLKEDFRLFISFINRMAYSGEKMDIKPIKFFELYQVAEYANKMLSDRQETEKALLESEINYRTLLNNIHGMVYRASYDWSVSIVSGSEELCGYTAQEINDKEENWLDIIYPEDIEIVFEEGSQLVKKQQNLVQRYRIITKEGRVRWIEDLKTSLFSAEGEFKWIDGIVFDITERKQIEGQVVKSLNEKEVLLREIHHRVKNNLNIVVSLLDLQKNQFSDAALNKAINDSKSRVMAMSLIHELLYSTENLAEIDLKKYIKTLGSNLIHIMETETYQIQLTVEVEDVRLKLDQAIPCGLILNELLTNSLKYAFEEDSGKILISARYITPAELELVLHDNGVGFSGNIISSESSSMGLEIVSLLVTDQLEGTMEMKNDNGARFLIRFPVK